MTDELSIQQQQPSSTPYVVTGGAVAGLGAGLGTHYYTKPKYGSYEDILKEAKDTANFQSKIDAAEGDKKTFLEAAKELANAEKDAEAKWENELKAFKEKSNTTVQETDEFKELVNKRNAAEEALKNKKAELEKYEIPAQEGKPTLKQQKAIAKVKALIESEKKNIAQIEKELSDTMKESANSLYDAASDFTKIDDAINEIRAQKAKLENKKRQSFSLQEIRENPNLLTSDSELEEINKSIEELSKSRAEAKKTYEQELKEIRTAIRNDIKERMSFPKGKNGEKLLDAKVNEIMTYIYDSIQEKTLNESVTRNGLFKLADKKDEAIKEIKNLTNKDLAGKEIAEIENVVGRHVKHQQMQLDKLTNLKELFKQAEEKAKASGGKTTTVEQFNLMLGSWKTPIKISRTTSVSGEEAKKFVDTLTKDELEVFKRLVKDDSEAAIDNAIKARKDNISKLQNSLNEIKAFDSKLVELGGEGAYIKNGVLYDYADKEIDLTKKYNLAEEVKATKSSKLANLEAQLSKLESEVGSTPARKYTEAEIQERIANEAKVLADANKAVEDARANLPKAEAKTAEELTADFLKEKGVKDKAEYIKSQTEEKSKSFIDKYGKELESKLGKNAGWKLAGITAGAVVLGGIIGKMFAPSAKEEIA